MEYFEFTISSPDESREAIMNKLSEIGSTGFFEKGEKILTYFDEKTDIAGVCEELSRFRDVLKTAGLDPAFSF